MRQTQSLEMERPQLLLTSWIIASTLAGNAKLCEFFSYSRELIPMLLKVISAGNFLFLQTTLPASWETCMQVRKQPLEPDMEQPTGSKLGREYIKAVYCHPAYLTSMQSTSCEMLGWMKHKLESRFLGEISITSDTQMIPPLWQKVKRN